MPVHRTVTPSIKFAGTHLYTWVERGTVRVKCLAQEHNTMSPARARTRTARSGDERNNHEATAPPTELQVQSLRGFTHPSRTSNFYRGTHKMRIRHRNFTCVRIRIDLYHCGRNFSQFCTYARNLVKLTGCFCLGSHWNLPRQRSGIAFYNFSFNVFPFSTLFSCIIRC